MAPTETVSDADGGLPEDVRAELVLIEIGSDQVDREVVEVDVDAIEAEVKKRLNGLVAIHVRARIEAEKRREASERLGFPYPELRPGQTLILERVETALEQKEHLLLQATTGIGKTVATLFPALRYCLAHDKRLFVLTAKTLQQEMATQVLALLNQESAFRSLRLRAKAKMCANGQVLCHEEYCPFAKDYQSKLQGSRVLERLVAEHEYLDPDSVFETARDAEVCPFEVSMELSNRVQVTVCDYNYAFDPYVSLSDFSAESDLSDVVLVVDEIHNLVDRGRGYYSPELSARAIRRAGEAMGHQGEAIHRRLEALCEELAGVVETAVADVIEPVEMHPRSGSSFRDRAAETTLPEDALLAPAAEARRRLRRLPGAPAGDQDPPAGGRVRGGLLRLPALPERPGGLGSRLQPPGGADRARLRRKAGLPDQDPVQGPEPLPRRPHQPDPRDDRPVGDPVTA